MSLSETIAAENHQLRVENGHLMTENIRLRGEVSRLQAQRVSTARRDAFAQAALTGLLASGRHHYLSAFEIADSMLAASDRKEAP